MRSRHFALILGLGLWFAGLGAMAPALLAHADGPSPVGASRRLRRMLRTGLGGWGHPWAAAATLAIALLLPALAAASGVTPSHGHGMWWSVSLAVVAALTAHARLVMPVRSSRGHLR